MSLLLKKKSLRASELSNFYNKSIIKFEFYNVELLSLAHVKCPSYLWMFTQGVSSSTQRARLPPGLYVSLLAVVRDKDGAT
jgi:hypothetical protein